MLPSLHSFLEVFLPQVPWMMVGFLMGVLVGLHLRTRRYGATRR